jgi:hypothetical protein
LFVHSALELKSESTFDRAVAEYTLDRLLPEVASAYYAMEHPGMFRGSIEKDISSLVAQKNPNAFKKEPEELAQDMAITSFLAMLFTYQSDWQLRPQKFSARYTIGMESAERLSQPEDCTKVSVQDITSNLLLAENVFSELAPEPFYRNGICLPPNAKMRIEHRAVVIQTDYCDINVVVKNSGMKMFGRPQLIRPGEPRSIIPENLSDGSARYTSMPIPIEVHVRYKRLYAKHRDIEKIKAWVGRLSAGIHIWFEGSGQDFQRLRSPLEGSAQPATNPHKDLPATQKSTPSAPDIPHG